MRRRQIVSWDRSTIVSVAMGNFVLIQFSLLKRRAAHIRLVCVRKCVIPNLVGPRPHLMVTKLPAHCCASWYIGVET